MADLRLECLITFALSGNLARKQKHNHAMQVQEYSFLDYKLVHAYHKWKSYTWETLDVYQEENLLFNARRRLGYKNKQNEGPWSFRSKVFSKEECDFLLDKLSRQIAFTPDLAQGLLATYGQC